MGAELDRLEVAIETSASQANKQLDSLIAKLEKISSQLNGINTRKLSNLGKSFNNVTTSTNTASKSIGTISSRLQNMNALLNKSKVSTNSLASSFGMFYATMFPVIRGIKKLGSSIESSMDYMETYNYFNVAMQKIGKEFGSQYEKFGYDSADSYAKSFQSRLTDLSTKMTGYKIDDSGLLSLTGEKSLGLDAEQLMAFQAKIAQVTNSVGLIGEVSTNASQALSMLSADMSSLYNVDLKSVMTNLSSGLIGQSRALYKYGIDITNANLQNYALANGISKAVSEMSQSEKMQLRLLAILQQSRTAWGDMANTLNLPANQLRVLRQNFSNLARTIGNLFLPVVAKVLPYINALVVAVKRLFEWLGGLFHINEKLAKIGVNTGIGFSDDISDMVDESDEVANSAGDIGNNLSDAEKSARKLRNTLLGFDQINALNDNGDISNVGSTGTAGVGGIADSIDLSGAIGDALAEYQKVWNEAFNNMQNKAEETADKIQAFFTRMYNAMEPFRNAVKSLWNEGLSELASFTGTALIDFYHESLVPIGTWAFGTEGAGFTRLVDVINNGLLAIDWDRLNNSLKEFWIAIEPYAEQFGEGLIDFFEDIVGLGVDAINGFPGLLDKITGALNRGDPTRARDWGYNLGILLTALLGFKAVTSIVSGIAALGNSFATLSTGLGALFGESGAFAKLGSGIAGLFAEKGIFGSGGLIVKALSGIRWGLFPLSGGNFIAPLGAIASGIVAVVAGIIDLWKTSETFRDNVKNMLGIIGGAFMYAKQQIWDEGLKPLWDSIKELFDSLYEIYESSGLKDIFEAVVTGIGYIASTALGGLIVDIGEFLGFLIGSVKKIVDALNVILDKVKGFYAEHEDIFDGLKRMFGGFVEFVSGIFTLDIGRAWDGIKDIFGGAADSIGAIFKDLGGLIKDAFGSAFDGIKRLWNKFANWLNSKLTIHIDTNSLIGEGISKLFGTSTIKLATIPTFANGGFPNTGEMFLARENGLTEMVGRIGSRAAVANNGQIVDGIAEAVYPAVFNAVVEAMIATGGGRADSGNIVVENTFKVDSETFYRMNQKGEQKYKRRYQVVTEF